MTLPGTPAVLVLLVLSSAVASASPPSAARELKRRQVVLDEATPQPLELRVAAGYSTVLLFTPPLDAPSVELLGAEGPAEHVRVVDGALVLRPQAEPPGGQRLRVPLADGREPRWVEFILTPHPTEVDAQVDVVRAPPEAARGCCDEGALARLVLAGDLDARGLSSERLSATLLGSGVEASRARLFRSSQREAVSFLVHNPKQGAPWALGEARLLDAAGREVARVKAWMEGARLEPGARQRVVVEWARGVQRREALSLEVREAQGTRSVVLRDMRF